LVALARIVKEWGIRGEVKALPLSAAVSTVLPGSEIQLFFTSGRVETKKISRVRRLKQCLLFSFHGIEDRDAAAQCREAVIKAHVDAPPKLREGEYYHDQIVGLPVFTTQNLDIGTVIDIFETGSNDVFVVKNGEKEYLIPAIRDIVKNVDLDRRRITILAVEGLLE
jgi:16S rRNA processing protein RimM